MSATFQPWLHDLVTVLSAPTVVLSEPSGQIRAGGAQGVLHADVRVLSQAVLEVGGDEPTPISSGLLDARTARFVSAARTLGDDTMDATVQVERERTVTPGEISERITLTCYADSGVSTVLALTVAADLAGVSDINANRVAAGPAPARPQGDGLTWPAGQVSVTLSAPGASVSTGNVLRWPVRLAGRGTCEVRWRLTMTDPSAIVIAPPPGSVAGVRAVGDDPRVSMLLEQSLADANALRMAVPQARDDVFLAAGAPWYFTLFGRDSIWAARLLLPFGWQLAAGTLRTLAALQGQRLDPATSEEPGKIPHELRRGGSLYYGTIDATPLWVCLLHDAWRWGMPEEQVRALLPSLRAALEWMRGYGDADGDGMLEYIDQSGHGLFNQGWKDSPDAIRFADGRIASPPIAPCEVQGYAYEAATHGADLLAAFGEPGAERWREWAGRLAEAFRQSFWVAGGSYPALALDRDKQRVDSLTSNIGHLLGTGLLTSAQEATVAARLAGHDMNSGFGLRTMSARNGGYNPLSYHCGSVWSHDTAIVIRGLFRSGHGQVAASLTDGLLSAAAAFGWRLPELFSGIGDAPWPTPYPASCRPQAWSAAVAGALIQALLGLDADVPGGTVTVRPPGVPMDGAGTRLHVDGLVAGAETFSAGIDQWGGGYLRGCTLNPVRSWLTPAPRQFGLEDSAAARTGC
jgi:glycogen debranching enzyme-like protein/amylo-alpha-1,6-glucosidase